MLSNSLKIFSAATNRKTTILFYSIKGSDSKKSGDKKQTSKQCDSTKSTNNKKEKKASICEVCLACPCKCNPSAPTMYDCRKYGHNLPSNSSVPQFETLQNIPTGIFRCTSEEVLGRGAHKCSLYKNPEYFSYQHMTFYDIHLGLRRYRSPSAETGRKK